MSLRASDKTAEENQIVEEAKHWEDLYYKENALVGLLINKIKIPWSSSRLSKKWISIHSEIRGK